MGPYWSKAMDGLSAYSFFSAAHTCNWGDPAGRRTAKNASITIFLRYPLVRGGLVLSVLSPKSHELEKSE